MRRTSIVPLLFLMTAPLAAQTPRGALVTAGVVDSFRFRMIRGADTVDAGWATDELRLGDRNSVRVFERTYRTVSPLLGTSTATMVDAWETLLPMVYRKSRGAGELAVAFAGEAATVSEPRPSGVIAETTHRFAQGTISSSSFDLWLRTAPLARGAEFSVAAFLADPIVAVDTFPAVVADEERVGGVDCWRIDAAFAGTPVSFWIAKQDRRMMRQVMRLAPGLAMLVETVGQRKAA